MSDTASSQPPAADPAWQRLRRAFDELVELEPAQQRAALARTDLTPELSAQLARLLDIDSRVDPLLVAGRGLLLQPAPAVVAAVPASAPALPRQLGRYQLQALLGRGGMGEVYLAHDALLERRIAIKLLSQRLLDEPQWLPRFRREAQAAGALNHPSILTVHDVGEIDGTWFLAMEFVAGETLRRRLLAGPLSIDAVLDLGSQIAGAIAAAHTAGVVHRDLKPENVMLRPDGLVKVLDFGLAQMTPQEPLRAAEARATQAGMLLGTMHYMSPEQARGLAVDARSDVFSLGVLLYEMLTGVVPFAGGTALDVLVALLDREPPPLAVRVPDLPPALGRLVTSALQKDPAKRPHHAGELLRELQRVRDERSVAPEGRDEAPADAVPEVHYARSGDVNIAYQVLGDGPLDLVFVMGWISHLEYFWREPSFARFLRRLAQFARVILFDKRGTGLSDRVATDRLPTLEQRMDDVRAVMDAVGSQRAVLCGISEGGPMCSLFAATHPEKTIALVMIGSYARRLRGEGYPWGVTAEAREHFFEEIRNHWGGPVGLSDRAPSMVGDAAFREWWAAYLRYGASPSAALALTRMNSEIDIRHVLPTVRVPTLVVHRTGDRCLRIEEGRYLAERIPGARMVELPGDDHLPFVGDQEAILSEVEAFLASVQPARVPDRVLATVLVARLASSPDGKRVPAPADALDQYRLAIQRDTTVLQGRSIAMTDRQLMATFDGPARAIRAACEVAAAAQQAGLAVRVGLHTGECVLQSHAVVGQAVEMATMVMQSAPDGTVVVSSTVRDLVAGAGFEFVPRGRTVPGPDGPLAVFSVGR
jgi:pimeloyl-ACP methyl ester carboxylesterase/tRNA A-37 threonylcarbamoyl transferase component Bud32